MLGLPDLAPGEWILFVHALSGYALLLAHGASPFIMYRLKQEREPAKVRLLLDLSQASVRWTRITFLVLILTGFLGGYIANYLTAGWMWASVVLFIVMLVVMGIFGMTPFNEIRKAAGLPHDVGMKRVPGKTPASPGELQKLLEKLRPDIIAGMSFPIFGIIVFLMMFKPF